MEHSQPSTRPSSQHSKPEAVLQEGAEEKASGSFMLWHMRAGDDSKGGQSKSSLWGPSLWSTKQNTSPSISHSTSSQLPWAMGAAWKGC